MIRAVLDIETFASEPDGQEETGPKAALDALQSRVICIGVILEQHFKATTSIAFVCDDERVLLRQFWMYLRGNKVSRFVAHNGLTFDLPYLWRRSVVQQVRPSIELDLRKFRNDFIYDTMNVWANWDSRSFPKLDKLASTLGVGKKSGSGDEVARLWKGSRFHDLAAYCLHDCWLTYACYCRMNFVDPTPEESVSTQLFIPEVESLDLETMDALRNGSGPTEAYVIRHENGN